VKAGEYFFRRIAAQFAFAPIAIADPDLRTGQAHRFPPDDPSGDYLLAATVFRQ